MVAEVQEINDEIAVSELPGWSLEWHDPRSLLTDRNVREVTPDATTIKSIAKDGVLQPIVAVRTTEGESEFWVVEGGGPQKRRAEGRTRVRFGENRTLAAIAGDRALVPVIVTGPEGDTDAENMARIVRQRAENTYRKGMTAREDAQAAHQLSLYGMTEKEIAEELLISRREARAAKKVGESQTGKAMLDENEDLDILTAAKIAEFEDDPERVKTLLQYVRGGRIKDLDAKIRDWKMKDKIEAEMTERWAALEAEGFRVIDSFVGDRFSPVRYVTALTDENGEPISAEQHASCPGHAMVIREIRYFQGTNGTEAPMLADLPEDERVGAKERSRGFQGIPVCDQAKELHPMPTPQRTPEQEAAEEQREAMEAENKEAARAERRRVISGNKEWDAAVADRRDWVQKNLLQRKTAPKGAVEYLTGELLLAQYAIVDGFKDGHPLAADWLGVEPGNEVQFAWQTMPAPRRAELRKQAEDITDNRRMVLLLALVLAANEKALNRQSWRGEGGCPQREYLRFIIEQGYPACSVERLAAGLPELPELTDDEAEEAEDATATE